MKYLLIVFVIVLVACTDYDYKISTMPCRELTYSELPTKVQKCLSEYSPDSMYYNYNMLLVEYKDCYTYNCEHIKSIIGPWTECHKLINKEKNVVYRIERGTPSPYIIYNNK